MGSRELKICQLTRLSQELWLGLGWFPWFPLSGQLLVCFLYWSKNPKKNEEMNVNAKFLPFATCLDGIDLEKIDKLFESVHPSTFSVKGSRKYHDLRMCRLNRYKM